MAGPAPPTAPPAHAATTAHRSADDKRRQLEKEKEMRRKKEEEKRRHEKEKREKEARSKEKNPLDSRLRRETPFMCHIRFKNDLPELPCDPKMLVNPIQPDKLSEFFVTSIEAELKKDLVLQPDLGIHVSLLDIQRYQVPEDKPPLDPADAALLVEDEKVGDARKTGHGGPRGRTFARERKEGEELQPWMMRTTYISNELSMRRAAAAAADRAKAQEQTETADEDAQIAAIEATFEAAQRPPVNREDTSLRPVEILAVLPDEDAWEHGYAQVTFPESDPVADDRSFLELTPSQRLQLLERAVLFHPEPIEVQQGADDREVVVLCVPQEPPPVDEDGAPSTSNRTVEVEELEGEYVRLKEYAVKRERDERYGTLLLRFEPHQVSYVEVGDRFVLRKHGQAHSANLPRKVLVRHRGLTLQEQKRRRKRLRQLEGGAADEGEDDMDADEMEED